MKIRLVSILLGVAMLATVLTGCGSKSKDTDSASDGASGAISVVSREDGSGTRGAFIELFGIQEEVNGEKIDNTTDSAEVTNSTAVMMATVAGNKSAIGYISLGSLNDTVKAVKIDGVEPSVANVENETYKISRPFNIATKADLSDVAKDFISYIMSAEGQKIVEDNGYISVGDKKEYKSSNLSGKITISGSSSVTPVMEALKEAYAEVNSKVTIELQQSDSTTGMTDAMNGVSDIGMASRELKDSETSGGLSATVIAKDGIAVIINNNSSIDNLTSDQVKQIYTLGITDWSEIK